MRAAVIACFAVACSEPATAPAVRPAAPAAPSGQDRTGAHEATWIGVLFERGSTRVRQVIPSSPAAIAKIVAGDQLVSVAGTRVTQGTEVAPLVLQHAAGDHIQIVVERDGKTLTIPVSVALRPDLEVIQRQTLLDRAAPGFTLPALDGQDIRLADLRGHVVVLDFWAPWCGPCLAAMPQLDIWHKQLAAQGLVVVGITSEDRDEIRTFVKDRNIGYAIVFDHDNALWRDYLIQGIPTTVIVDKAGIIRHVELGFGGDYADAEALITKLLSSR